MEGVHIGVMGAGSIGCFVGGSLLAAEAAEVTLVGRERLREATAAHGLAIQDLDASPVRVPPERVTVATDPAALAQCDVVLCCVKSAQTAEVAETLASVLQPHAVVASLQNGVRNPDVLRAHLPEQVIVPAIVGFNVVSRPDALFHRATSGTLAVERCSATPWRAAVRAFKAAGIEVEEHEDLAPEQWTKLLVNLNNALSALSGAPTGDLIGVRGYRRIMAALIAEGLHVLRAAKIKPAPLRGVPVGLMVRVLGLPTPIVRLITGRQVQIDPDARSSMWEDLTRGRSTEVDYLNGEVVALATRTGSKAPLNARMVELVHQAEEAGAGSPELSPEALWARLTERD